MWLVRSTQWRDGVQEYAATHITSRDQSLIVRALRIINRWSIRQIIATILLLVVGINVVAELLIQQLIITPSFLRLEQDEAREAVARCVKIFDREVKHLKVFTEDWSAWDDTYRFAFDRNPEYIRDNLTPATFRSAQLNLIYLFDNKGAVIWGGVRTNAAEAAVEPDAVLAAELGSAPFVRGQDTIRATSGVFLSSRGPMMIAVQPILANESKGPSRGAFIMGRFLGDAQISALGDQAGVSLSVTSLRDASSSVANADMLNQLSQTTPAVCRIKNDDILSIYTIYPDIAGESGLLLEADILRDITPKGALATKYAVASSLTLALVVLLSLVWALRTTVVNPLRALTERVMNFSIGGSPGAAVAVTHGNEIDFLDREFETMKTRLAADLELRQRGEARMRALLVSAPDGIVTINRDGNVESVNPAAESMFGYGPHEMEGKNWRDLVSDALRIADDDAVVTAIRERSEARGFMGYEAGGVRKDGSVFPMHGTVSEVVVGEERLFLAILRDITELNRMHERVLRAEHLAAIGEMGASVAHEIKNPIAGISGAVQVLRDTLAADDSRREVFKEIIDQVNRVDSTVRQLLMFAKPWAPEKRLWPLFPLLNDCIARAKKLDAFQNVVFQLEGDSTITAPLDRYLVEQVVANLFQNAAQAMPEGGVISCAVLFAKGFAEVSISDTGIGIPKEALDEIFRPFFTTRMRGTGLGLAVSRQIMDAHGGVISAVSRPGAGTCITLKFPKGE